MSKRDPQLLLEDIQTAIDKIERYTAGMNRDHFLADVNDNPVFLAIGLSQVLENMDFFYPQRARQSKLLEQAMPE